LIRYHLENTDVAQAKSYFILAELTFPVIEFHHSGVEHYLQTRKLTKFKTQLAKFQHRFSIIEGEKDDVAAESSSRTSHGDAFDSCASEESSSEVFYDNKSKQSFGEEDTYEDSIDEDSIDEDSIDEDDSDMIEDEPFPFDEVEGLLIKISCAFCMNLTHLFAHIR
jgi:hypothetical protein